MPQLFMSSHRRSVSLHLQYVREVLPRDCISPFPSRDIARVLRETIEGFHTGWKPSLNDWAKTKFKGVRYVDQDGVLADKVQVARVEPRVAPTSKGVIPPVAAGLLWGSERAHMEFQDVGPGLGGVLMDNDYPTQSVDPFSVGLFADPSVLFPGPSSSWFTSIGEQGIARGHYLPYDLAQFFYGGGTQTFTTDFRDVAER